MWLEITIAFLRIPVITEREGRQQGVPTVTGVATQTLWPMPSRNVLYVCLRTKETPCFIMLTLHAANWRSLGPRLSRFQYGSTEYGWCSWVVGTRGGGRPDTLQVNTR